MPEAKLDAETLALLRQMLGADEPDDNQSSEEQNDSGSSGGVPAEWHMEANGEEGGTSEGTSEDFDEDDYDLSSDDFYDDEEDAFVESSEEGVVEPASHVEPIKSVENANQEQSFVPDPIQPASVSSENTETGYEQSSPIGESEPVSPFSSSYSNPIPETEQRQVDTSAQEYQKQSIEEMRQLNAALMAQIAQMQSQLVTMQEFINSNEQRSIMIMQDSVFLPMSSLLRKLRSHLALRLIMGSLSVIKDMKSLFGTAEGLKFVQQMRILLRVM